MNSPHEAQSHHENSVLFKKRFTTDVNCPEKAVISNSSMLERLTVLHNHDKAKFNDRVFEHKKINEVEGGKQFLHFWEKRLVLAELSIVIIPLNSYNLPENYNKKSAYDPVMTAVMMTKFAAAGKNRRYLVEDALNTEVFGIAQSLASDQFSLYHGTKSFIIASLIQATDSKKFNEIQVVACSSFPCFFGRSNHRGCKPLLTFPSFSITRSWTSLLCPTDATLLRIDILRKVVDLEHRHI